MTASWSPDELRLMNAAGELRIAVKRSDGSLRPWVPIWVVCAGGQVYVPGGAGSMVTATAAATTLQLSHE
jgi:hypothetical protein